MLSSRQIEQFITNGYIRIDRAFSRELGTFPVRFPTGMDTGDTGWHLDASFAGPDSVADDSLSCRVNVNSKGRALLVLFLFSDVGEAHAPTRISVGSHMMVARMLEPAGEDGIALRSLDFASTATCREVLATGEAGTVYLCHPFLVHAAQVNRGRAPRFMAQPSLFPKKAFDVRGKVHALSILWRRPSAMH